MKGLLSSPRRRRRAAWLAALLLVAGTIAFLAVFYPNTSPTRHGAPFTSEPIQRVAPLPRSVKFTAADQKAVNAVASDFIATAVFRRRLSHSYDLVCNDFRQGMTRKQWMTGEIPVVPYPKEAVALVRWKVDYSYRGRVGLHVAFLPKPNAKVGGMVFAIELKNACPQSHHHWLVSYWTPTGGQVLSTKQRAAAAGPPVELKTRLSAGWVFAPVGALLLLILSVPAVLTFRGWRARRRVDRTYRTLSP